MQKSKLSEFNKFLENIFSLDLLFPWNRVGLKNFSKKKYIVIGYSHRLDISPGNRTKLSLFFLIKVTGIWKRDLYPSRIYKITFDKVQTYMLHFLVPIPNMNNLLFTAFTAYMSI